jgi:alpha-tubulin suppressor-like RCC1 family protein
MRWLLTALCAAAATLCAAADPAVSAGNRHSVALHADGTVRAWGDDSAGQLGLGRTLTATAPALVTGITQVDRVSSGLNHVVALRRDRTVWAWGINTLGQLGDGTSTSRATPAPVAGLTDVIAISAGEGHTLALRADGSVWSWGQNYRGQLGYDDSTQPHTVPSTASARLWPYPADTALMDGNPGTRSGRWVLSS